MPAEDPAPALGGIGVGEVRVVDGVVHAGSHRRHQVEEGEGPHVGGEAHQRREDREDQQGHRGDHLATAPVGPQGEGHRPQQLGHRAHEGHRPEGGVVDVERVLEVGPDDGDAVAEGARHEGRRGQQHQGGEATDPEDPEERRRLALTGPGHHVERGDVPGVAALGDDLFQELLGNGEVEQHLVGHGSHTLSMTSPSDTPDGSGAGRVGAEPRSGRRRRRRCGHGEWAVGQHAQSGPADPIDPGPRPPPRSHRGPGSSGTTARSTSVSPSEYTQTSARRRTRPSTWVCQASTLPGPGGRTRSSASDAPSRMRAKALSAGQAVGAGRGHHDDAAVGDHPLGGGHALDRLVEVAVEGMAAVGGQHHLEPAVHRLGDGVGRGRAGGEVAVGQGAGEHPGEAAAAVDGHVHRQIGRAQGGGGADELVDRIAVGDHPGGVGRRPGGSGCGPRGWWRWRPAPDRHLSGRRSTRRRSGARRTRSGCGRRPRRSGGRAGPGPRPPRPPGHGPRRRSRGRGSGSGRRPPRRPAPPSR